MVSFSVLRNYADNLPQYLVWQSSIHWIISHSIKKRVLHYGNLWWKEMFFLAYKGNETRDY